MSDVFAAYGAKATSVAVPRLVGVIKTRSAARDRYTEIVAELEACEDSDTLSGFLCSIKPELAQFQAELDLFWEGDGDFLGLAREIERAQARVDDPAYSGDYYEGTGQ